jgi:hypothetical protein
VRVCVNVGEWVFVCAVWVWVWVWVHGYVHGYMHGASDLRRACDLSWTNVGD